MQNVNDIAVIMPQQLERPSRLSWLRKLLPVETIKMALQTVRAHKFRSFLTVLGIVIGVATVVAIASILTGLRSSIVAIVEESLRTETPVQSNFRVVMQDTTLAGVVLPKGAVLVLRYGSANRDERKFQDSEKFDVCRRDARAHISFGGGIHHCPGGMLAREEVKIAFTELLRRFDNFELACDESELRYHPTFFLRGLQSLPIRATPRSWDH